MAGIHEDSHKRAGHAIPSLVHASALRRTGADCFDERIGTNTLSGRGRRAGNHHPGVDRRAQGIRKTRVGKNFIVEARFFGGVSTDV